jgi:PAS domain S-box-containing protein
MTRVLIVDDDAQNLYMLRALLEGSGYAVDEAADGVGALALADRALPDLVVSDLLMPALDGYGLLRRWRADDRFRHVPFIVYTATYTDPRDERLALALGADAFLVKPAEPADLMALVRDVLDRHARGEPTRVPSAPPQQLLQDYNDVLIRKLEQKFRESEQRNLELQREVGERRRADARLLESEARFRATFEQAAVGVAHVTLEGRFMWVNNEFCRMTGYDADELRALTYQALTAPEDQAESEEARQALLEGAQRVYAAEKRYQRKDGTLLWVNVVTTPLCSEDGNPLYFITVIVDITDRKQATEALQLRDRAIQELSQGILIRSAKRPDCPIIYASHGFARMTGYAEEEVIGRPPQLLQGPGTDPATTQALLDALAAGQACSVEILHYRKDGTSFWDEVSLNPVRDDTGAVIHFVGIHNDVTERRRLEEQLRQAQKMEAVGRLAGGIAHDFNNLLTIICGCSDLLVRLPSLTDDDRELVREIYAAGERAAALTRQLLGFSRRSVLQPRVVDLNELVRESGKMLRRLIGEDIDLALALGADLRPVKVDPGQLDQVLMNLAVNARDAMPRGGRLTIETANVTITDDYAASHVQTAAGPHVMLAVTDTGVGMTPDVMAHIFEPFYTTKGVDQGTGLGLSMVLGVVQQSGGGIHVYSEPNVGTSFKIYLPVTTEAEAGVHVASTPARARGSETVLLVEDEPSVRALASRTLEMHGYRVLQASDGKDALDVAGRHGDGAIDLVLSDVVMPNLSGPELVARLRARFPHLKVLFMSGYTDEAVVRHGLLDAQVSFVQKPYTPSDLAQRVRKVLDEGRDQPAVE